MLSFPRDVSPEAMMAFVSGLAGLRLPWWKRLFDTPKVVFEVIASEEAIRFGLETARGEAEYVIAQLRAAIPGARADLGERQKLTANLAAELRLRAAERLLAVTDPKAVSSALLASLRPLRAQELVIVQWVITPAKTPSPVSKNSRDAKKAGSGSWLETLLLGPRKPQPDREKLDGPHFLASLRLGVIAANAARRRHLLRRLMGVFHIVSRPGASFYRRAVASRLVSPRIARPPKPLSTTSSLLSARELAAILGAPIGEVTVDGLSTGRSRTLPVPAGMPRSGVGFAHSNYQDSDRLLTFGPASLPYNAWLVGPTGSGKSTTLAHIAAGYMRLGATVILVDSKRDLVRDVIELVPAHRLEDVVIIDPADEQPAGINLLAGDNVDRTADQLVGVMTRLWPGYVGPRSQDYLRAAFSTLAASPGTTLVELPLLLQDAGFRRRLVSKIDDPVILEPQWAAFDALSPGEAAQHIGAPLNKIRAILARRALRDIVGQSEGLDIAELLRRPSVLLVSLSKGLIGEDSAALLAAILIMRIWSELQARVALPPEERRPIVLIFDELQDYVGSVPMSFADILAQVRGLGAGVVAAHQHMSQLPPSLRLDLRANARTKIAFGLSATDAKAFAEEFSPHLSAADLHGLGRYEVAAQLCVDGEVLAPATGVTLPPLEPTGFGKAARELSRTRFGRPRAEIEAEIRARLSGRPGEGTVGRRRRA